MSRNAILQRLVESLTDYLTRRPNRAPTALQFIEFAKAEPGCLDRGAVTGHFTASAFVVSADGLRTLLTHHAKLGRWLQPGGHVDRNEDVVDAALREAAEETGLEGLVVDRRIFDLDRHWIPPRLAEAGHWHYDVRFLVRVTGNECFSVSGESLALAWRNVEELATAPETDESLSRMARQWLGLCKDRSSESLGS